jgi:hypothetical protein
MNLPLLSAAVKRLSSLFDDKISLLNWREERMHMKYVREKLFKLLLSDELTL